MAGGWLVIVEVIGMVIKGAIEAWGQPTDEVKKKLLAQITLPTPGEADGAKTEADSVLLK